MDSAKQELDNDLNESLERRKEGLREVVNQLAYYDDYHLIYDFIEYNPDVDDKEFMRILEDAIIRIANDRNNPLIAYEFMYEMATDFKIKNFDLNRFENYIISTKNPKFMDYCIRCIKGTNVPRMLKALCDTKSVKYISRVKEEYNHGVNAEEYWHFILFDEEYDKALAEAKKILYIPNWFVLFDNSSPEAFCKEVIENKNPYFINELADYLEYLIEFKLGENDLEKISLLKSLIEALNEAIIKYGEMLDKYEYAWSVKGMDKILLQREIIKVGDPKFMYYFREIPGADAIELDEAINLTGNEKYIERLKEEKRTSGEGNTLTLEPK